MTKVKICGMTRPEDIEVAEGADYLGFVVETDSPRVLPLAAAQDLMSVSKAKKVVVTTLSDIEGLVRIARTLEPEVLQAHALIPPGDLAELVERCPCEVWGLVPIGAGGELDRAKDISRVVHAVVMDTGSARLGGSGTSHDWNLSRAISEGLDPHPVVLAGGLNCANVRDAIVKVRPYAVDVSSGVEIGGRKDPDLVRRFIGRAKEVAT